MRHCFFIALFFSILCTSQLLAEDWAQFLGPQRNGISRESGLIDRFPSNGPKVLWRTSLGVGMSGIVVADGTACTLYQDAQQQFVVAVDAMTGKEKWKTSIAPNYKNAMGNGPRSTPIIDRGNVFAMSGEGILGCYSLLSGKELWKTDPLKMFGGEPAEYGMACSPILTDEHVIITVGAPQATVVAFDRQSGQLTWKAGTGSPAGYSSPALLKVDQQVQLVVFHGNGALGLEPHSGQSLWEYPFTTDYNCNIATPISIGGNVLLSAGENHGTVLLSVPAQPGGNVKAVWESFGNRSHLRNEWQTSILLDGFLYGFDNVGSAGPVTNLTCVKSIDGTVMWQKRRFGKGNMIAADGKLWCTTMEGELIIVKATSEQFQELDRATLLGQTRQAPALCNGFIYLRDGVELICVDVRK